MPLLFLLGVHPFRWAIGATVIIGGLATLANFVLRAILMVGGSGLLMLP